MRIAFIAAMAALAAACAPVVVEEEMEAEFVYTGPIPVVEGGYRHTH